MNDPFDLSIDTAELISRPFFKRLIDILIYPQYKVLFYRQNKELD
jgi:hypothetical protein